MNLRVSPFTSLVAHRADQLLALHSMAMNMVAARDQLALTNEQCQELRDFCQACKDWAIIALNTSHAVLTEPPLHFHNDHDEEETVPFPVSGLSRGGVTPPNGAG